jgi:hypothetical protein
MNTQTSHTQSKRRRRKLLHQYQKVDNEIRVKLLDMVKIK